MQTQHALAAAVIGGALILAGCSDAGDTTTAGPTTGRTPAGSTAAGPTAAGQGPTVQPEGAQRTYNDADVAFAQQMIPHHQQALQMARMATEQAASDEVRELAERIEAAQGPEIATMTGWLVAWGEKVPDLDGTDSMAGMDHGGETPGSMGMMTEEDMDRLMATSGRDFDRAFLTMMIAHHEGAIEMARAEQATGKDPGALALAGQVEVDQAAEIETMRDLLGP